MSSIKEGKPPHEGLPKTLAPLALHVLIKKFLAAFANEWERLIDSGGVSPPCQMSAAPTVRSQGHCCDIILSAMATHGDFACKLLCSSRNLFSSFFVERPHTENASVFHCQRKIQFSGFYLLKKKRGGGKPYLNVHVAGERAAIFTEGKKSWNKNRLAHAVMDGCRCKWSRMYICHWGHFAVQMRDRAFIPL